MKQKRHNGHFLKWATAIVLTFAFFAGCRKYDSILPDTGQNYEELKSKFFNTNSTADIEIKKLAADIKKQDSIFRFLPDFVRKNGLPKWDKVIYKTSSNSKVAGRQNSSISTNSITTSTKSSSSTSNNDNQGVFFIPLQSQNSQEIKSYITAYKHGDSAYTYKLYNKDSLSSNSYKDGDTKKALVNSLGILAFFEKSINGQEISHYNLSNNEVVEFKNPDLNLSDTEPSNQSGINSNSLSTSLTSGCSYSITITETWTEINVYVNGELVYHYESYEVSVVAVFQGDCSSGGGGGGYDPGNGGSGGWYNWGTGYNNVPYWNNYNYNSWLYPWWTSGGASGSTGSLGFPYDFNFFNLYNGSGGKPVSEYADTAKCQGLQDIWNNYTNNEVMSFITADGKLIVTDILPLSGGSTRGLYKYNDPVTNTTQYYYTYPVSQGAPSQSYTGMVNNGQYYFIPVVASVHTHTPCRTDGTNGVSHQVGPEDQALATNHPGLRNWVIGCGAVAQFDGSNSNFFNVQSGPLSNTCSTIN